MESVVVFLFLFQGQSLFFVRRSDFVNRMFGDIRFFVLSSWFFLLECGGAQAVDLLDRMGWILLRLGLFGQAKGRSNEWCFFIWRCRVKCVIVCKCVFPNCWSELGPG